MNGGVPEHRPVHAVPEFTSKRERGLVWACDLKQSSSYLNDDGPSTPSKHSFPGCVGPHVRSLKPPAANS